MPTIHVAGGVPTIMEWVADHGLAAADLTSQVDLNDDGTVTVHRYVRGDDGMVLLVDVDACQHCGRGSGSVAPATEPVIVHPTRPFPVPVGAL